tara:strand:- start:476 stop:748 length:273 start_codon:yes stop_codon:yes gene_type:complete
MYKKINRTSKKVEPSSSIPDYSKIIKQDHLFLAQHKAQFNIESNRNMSLNEMKGLSHNNFINNTNNMREDYQKQHLDKNKNIQINLGYRG